MSGRCGRKDNPRQKPTIITAQNSAARMIPMMWRMLSNIAPGPKRQFSYWSLRPPMWFTPTARNVLLRRRLPFMAKEPVEPKKPQPAEPSKPPPEKPVKEPPVEDPQPGNPNEDRPLVDPVPPDGDKPRM